MEGAPREKHLSLSASFRSAVYRQPVWAPLKGTWPMEAYLRLALQEQQSFSLEHTPVKARTFLTTTIHSAIRHSRQLRGPDF